MCLYHKGSVQPFVCSRPFFQFIHSFTHSLLLSFTASCSSTPSSSFTPSAPLVRHHSLLCPRVLHVVHVHSITYHLQALSSRSLRSPIAQSSVPSESSPLQRQFHQLSNLIMPNKYSHALVLSHFQSRGLIKFPQAPPSPYVAPLPVESRLRIKPKSQQPATDDLFPADESSPTPVEPAVTVKPAPSHRSTPSIVTEIYAPERTSTPPQDPPRPNSPSSSLSSLSTLNLDSEFDDGFSSETHSLTTPTSASSSSFLWSTPRSSVSTGPESPILGSFDDFPPTRAIYPIMEDYAAKPWEDSKTTPAVFRLESLDPYLHYHPALRSPSTRSPSPDDAAPPPITRYRRASSIPIPKQNRTSLSFTKPSRPGPYPGTLPTTGRNSNFDRQRGERSALGLRITGSKLLR